MLLDQFWQSVEARLEALRRLWLVRVRPRTEAERLTAEIADKDAELMQCTALRDQLRVRVAQCERRAVRLTGQIAECVRAGYGDQAWPLALELEEVHRALAEDQAALRRLEQLCWSQEFQLRQLRRKLEHLSKPSRRSAPRRSESNRDG